MEIKASFAVSGFNITDDDEERIGRMIAELGPHSNEARYPGFTSAIRMTKKPRPILPSGIDAHGRDQGANDHKLDISEMFLTKDELAILTGYKIKSKQIVALRQMGLPFWMNTNYAPVVARVAIEGIREVVDILNSTRKPPVRIT